MMSGEDLKRWRKRHGYATQESLRKEIGVKSRGTISAWENAEELPRLLELALIALAQVPQCRDWGGTHRETSRAQGPETEGGQR